MFYARSSFCRLLHNKAVCRRFVYLIKDSKNSNFWSQKHWNFSAGPIALNFLTCGCPKFNKASNSALIGDIIFNKNGSDDKVYVFAEYTPDQAGDTLVEDRPDDFIGLAGDIPDPVSNLADEGPALAHEIWHLAGELAVFTDEVTWKFINTYQ